MSLAERLKQVRESLGYTQKEMAKAVSVIMQTWQVYEAGKSVPGGNVLEALARMGFNVNWILTGVGPMELHEKEVKRLLCEEAHDKLKERIRHITRTPGRLYNVEAFPFEQIQDYLKGDYWPNYDQIQSICRLAGAAFAEKEFIDVITSVDLKSVYAETKREESERELEDKFFQIPFRDALQVDVTQALIELSSPEVAEEKAKSYASLCLEAMDILGRGREAVPPISYTRRIVKLVSILYDFYESGNEDVNFGAVTSRISKLMEKITVKGKEKSLTNEEEREKILEIVAEIEKEGKEQPE